ncbi:MAG: multidrug effflux MFS transporter [Alphaproteobacteria bacterium]|nr:multidrug effflux MFS transporter [Alphaproteobacteria bacterium]
MTAPAPLNRTRLTVVLGMLSALGPLSIDAYLPALPTIDQQLGGGALDVEMTLSAYFLGLATSQLVWGPVADRFGRKGPLLVGLGLHLAGSLLAAVAPSMGLLLVARFVQAVGGAAGIVLVRTIIRDHFDTREAAKVLSEMMLIMGAAPILAPSIGGALLGHVGWRGIFGFLGLAALAAIALVATTLPAVGAPAAPVAQRRRDVLLGVLRDPVFVAFTFALAFAQAGMFAYIAGSPALFIDHLGLDPSVFAIVFGANAFALIASSQINRGLLRRFSPLAIVRVASVALVAVATAARLTTGLDAGTWAIEASLVGFLALMGLTFANTVALALDRQGQRAGLASGLMGALQYTLAALGSAAVGALSDGTGSAMGTVMLACALGAAASVALGSRALAAPDAVPAST